MRINGEDDEYTYAKYTNGLAFGWMRFAEIIFNENWFLLLFTMFGRVWDCVYLHRIHSIHISQPNKNNNNKKIKFTMC